MSTTFEVYPSAPEIPTLQRLLDDATGNLHAFLERIGIDARPPITFRLLRSGDNVELPHRDDLRWNHNEIGWFQVGSITGGTDAYYESVDEHSTLDVWHEYLREERFKPFSDRIQRSLAIGHYWSFRRSAGQPAVINIAYGILAASLAAITDGFVFSDDSAWDWERLPALPDDFLDWYFVPELALGEDFREWSERCIKALPDELSAER